MPKKVSTGTGPPSFSAATETPSSAHICSASSLLRSQSLVPCGPKKQDVVQVVDVMPRWYGTHNSVSANAEKITGADSRPNGSTVAPLQPQKSAVSGVHSDDAVRALDIQLNEQSASSQQRATPNRLCHREVSIRARSTALLQSHYLRFGLPETTNRRSTAIFRLRFRDHPKTANP